MVIVASASASKTGPLRSNFSCTETSSRSLYHEDCRTYILTVAIGPEYVSLFQQSRLPTKLVNNGLLNSALSLSEMLDNIHRNTQRRVKVLGTLRVYAVHIFAQPVVGLDTDKTAVQISQPFVVTATNVRDTQIGQHHNTPMSWREHVRAFNAICDCPPRSPPKMVTCSSRAC